jgi:hypothetical protein
MSEISRFEFARPLQATCALIAFGAIAIFAVRSLSGQLWLDELLTLTLVQATSLPKLWSGIIAGIDGNPPLYLTFAWLITHAVPQALSPVAVLKLTNVVLTITASFALYRIGRRVASASACWIGAFLFAALNDNLLDVALELRTYALYFLMAALAVLFQQRLIERRRGSDVVALAVIYAGLTLAHTFGIIYVACIAFAGWLSRIGDGTHYWRQTAAAIAPAVIVLACWVPFFLQQSAVGKPYLWIGPPGVPDLLETLFASKLSMWIAIVELYCLISAAFFALRRGEFQFRSALYDAPWQSVRYVVLVLAGITGFTLTAWIVSVALFPLFVPRYFTPQLIASLLLHAAFGEWLVRLAKHRLPSSIGSFAIGAIVAPPALFCLAILSRSPVRGEAPCTDSAGAYFETDFVNGNLPAIAESPQVWLPRATYANHRAAYLFPLDWDVVLKYPERARGNAVDFHILENIKSWTKMDQVVSTEDIVGKYPQFLVIEQSGRAWFHNLTTTRDVSAQKLNEVTSADGSQSCTLWKVTSVRARS